MSNFETVQRHYGTEGLLARIDEGLIKLGKTPDTVTLEDFAPVDEFHFRATAATLELIDLLDPDPGMHVLDLGSGLGGPARRLAAARGCQVTGIDLTEEYCAVGTVLNERLGLAGQVNLVQGDATDLSRFGDAFFDTAWTIHVGMNIADKAGFYGEAARVLKPGGRFVVFDVFTTGEEKIHLPMPWAQESEASFPISREQLEEHLRDAGFEVVEIRDQTSEARGFIEQALARASQAVSPPPLGLHVVLGPVFREIAPNMMRNFAEERVAVAALLCRRNG